MNTNFIPTCQQWQGRGATHISPGREKGIVDLPQKGVLPKFQGSRFPRAGSASNRRMTVTNFWWSAISLDETMQRLHGTPRIVV
jgi:hypothetical protein